MNPDNNQVATLDAFIEEFSYPAHHGVAAQNLPNHPVHRRSDRGNSAAYFSFPGLKALEAHVSEISPGETTQTHRHSCEALFYVLAGHGKTVLWSDGQAETQIEWKAGDLFCTPVLWWHRHSNTDSLLAARYLEITTIPLMKSVGTWLIEVSDCARASEIKTLPSEDSGA